MSREASGTTRVVLASSNAGKVREFARLLAPLRLSIVPQGELGIDAAEEPHPTFVENALAKARHASRASGLPALADDSGICVPALGGAPGVYSARFSAMRGGPAGDPANNDYLIQRLRELNPRFDDDEICSAYYVCVLVWMRSADDPQPVIAEGIWWGRVVAQARGDHGFGYDPHFWLPDKGCTAAELDPDEKNRISHRAQAMQQLARRLADG
ncbi:MAG: RdgB/HAM1 family non-canonical purine NTP pyrophosphatase [Burkholderiaceae bacterium]